MLDAARIATLRSAAMPPERTPDLPAPAPSGGWVERHWQLALVLLVLATFLIRARYFGNPLIDVDEEFYLLTGDRMLHGAIPYVDLWDRKPVGLFLLYAAIRLLGGMGILQYQLVAAGFAGATAVMIAVMARRIASPGAALVAGLAYVPALAMSGGQGGQTPVFYNLPMIVAAWLLLGLVAPRDGRPPGIARIRRHGAGAMLLVGISLQIKYSAVFEGVFFGLALLWLAWRTAPRLLPRAGDAAFWIALALAPTALAWGWYVSIGQGPAFVYANFTSILARGPVAAGHQEQDLLRILVRLIVFTLPIAVSYWIPRRHGRMWRTLPAGRAANAFLVAWLIAALAGFAAFGTFFNHYALPLLPPLAIVAAPAFAIRWRHAGMILGGISMVALAIAYPLDAAKYERRRGDAATAARLASAIAPRLGGRCLYVFYGDPILYHLTHSCLPTRWAFPFHLAMERESTAIGVDAEGEARRIMATRPPVIVDTVWRDPELNLRVAAIVRTTIAREYRPLLTIKTERGGTILYVPRITRSRAPLPR